MGSHTKFVAISAGAMIALCCGFQLLRGQSTPAGGAPAGVEVDRYQLDTTDTEMIVIDTATGHVWSRPFKPKSGKWVDEGAGPHGT